MMNAPTLLETPPLHALVVDDCEGMRRTVAVLLQLRNIHSTPAVNGTEAVKHLSNDVNTHPF